MAQHLPKLRDEASALLAAAPGSGDPPRSGQVAALALKAARLMVDEVLDWRVVFLDRPARAPS